MIGRIESAALAALASTGVLGACTIEFRETVVGSGVPASEIRAVDPFQALAVEGLEVSVQVGSGPFVTLHGDDNLLVYVLTEVSPGGELSVRVEGGYELSPPPRLELRVPELVSLAYQGAGSVDLRGLAGESLELRIQGAADLVAEGVVGDLNVSVAGSGDLDLFDLVADRVVLHAVGSGDVHLHAVEDLEVRAYGSGDVVYRGTPAVDGRVLGSGTVHPVE